MEKVSSSDLEAGLRRLLDEVDLASGITVKTIRIQLEEALRRNLVPQKEEIKALLVSLVREKVADSSRLGGTSSATSEGTRDPASPPCPPRYHSSSTADVGTPLFTQLVAGELRMGFLPCLPPNDTLALSAACRLTHVGLVKYGGAAMALDLSYRPLPLSALAAVARPVVGLQAPPGGRETPFALAQVLATLPGVGRPAHPGGLSTSALAEASTLLGLGPPRRARPWSLRALCGALGTSAAPFPLVPGLLSAGLGRLARLELAGPCVVARLGDLRGLEALRTLRLVHCFGVRGTLAELALACPALEGLHIDDEGGEEEDGSDGLKDEEGGGDGAGGIVGHLGDLCLLRQLRHLSLVCCGGIDCDLAALALPSRRVAQTRHVDEEGGREGGDQGQPRYQLPYPDNGGGGGGRYEEEEEEEEELYGEAPPAPPLGPRLSSLVLGGSPGYAVGGDLASIWAARGTRAMARRRGGTGTGPGTGTGTRGDPGTGCLTELDLCGCEGVVGDLSALGAHLPRLKRVDLEGCGGLRGDVAAGLLAGYCGGPAAVGSGSGGASSSALAYLNLSGCGELVGDLGALAQAGALGSLEVLHAGGCRYLTGALEALAAGAPKLQELVLNGTQCAGRVEHLAEACPDLALLSLVACARVGGNVDALAPLRHLSRVFLNGSACYAPTAPHSALNSRCIVYGLRRRGDGDGAPFTKRVLDGWGGSDERGGIPGFPGTEAAGVGAYSDSEEALSDLDS